MDYVFNFLKAHWDEIIILWLFTLSLLKSIRDAVDKTPEVCDSFWDWAILVMEKFAQQMFLGKRPKPDPGSKDAVKP